MTLSNRDELASSVMKITLWIYLFRGALSPIEP